MTDSKPVTDNGNEPTVVDVRTSRNVLNAILNDAAPVGETLVDAELPEELRGPAGDILMPKREGGDDDPNLELKKYIVAFVLVFTKSVQRSGYYGDGNHPEAVKSKQGLYSLFRRIVGGHHELTFIRKAVGKEKDVLVDGVLDGMVSLRNILPNNMADLYIPRFQEYLERRCLVSLSIKRSIDEKRFNTFVDLLSYYAREFRDDSRKEGERFSRSLTEHEIFDISVVFDEDMIASNRKLPWQAELILSRLRKDLRSMPYLRGASDEELKKIKMRVFNDTIRQLRATTFMIAVLRNADLIMDRLEGNPLFTDLDIVKSMVEGVEIGFLSETCREIMKLLVLTRKKLADATTDEERKESAEEERIWLGILAHMNARFLSDGSEASMNALDLFFQQNLVSYEDLPPALKERIGSQKLFENFVRDPDRVLTRFSQPLNDKDFSEFLGRFLRMVPILADKEEYALLARLVGAVVSQRNPAQAARYQQIETFMETIATPHLWERMRGGYETPDKALRTLVEKIFVSYGQASVPTLLGILKESEDKWVRKRVLHTLTEIGAVALPSILYELSVNENPWYFVRNLVRLLADMGNKKAATRLPGLLHYAHPTVREEALGALVRLTPESAEPQLLQALKDEEAQVRLRAVALLGGMRNQSDKLLRYYRDVLEGRAEVGNEAMLTQVYLSLAQLNRLDESRRKNFETILLSQSERIVDGGWTSWFKFTVRKREMFSDTARAAFCRAIGNLGRSRKALSILDRLAHAHDPVLAAQAADAQHLIHEHLKMAGG